jgi:hypothetical protein
MFKKTLAAVAVGMVAFGAQAAEFKIGDDVVFQANFDLLAEFANKKEAVGNSQNLLGVGQIQLRSTKTLTPDLSVFGQIEVDFDPSINNAPALADDSRIGLASKQFGTFTVGQFDSFMEDNISEVLGFWGHAESSAYVAEPTTGNDGRAIQFVTPKLQGFFGVIGMNYSTKDKESSAHSMGLSYVLGYDLNGLKVAVGQTDLPKYKDDYSAHTVEKSQGISASYKFGDTTVAGLVSRNISLTGFDTNYYGVAVSHVMGPFDFGVSLQNVAAKTSATVSTNSNQVAAGIGYTVTKGTVIYFDVNTLNAANNVGDFWVAGIQTKF